MARGGVVIIIVVVVVVVCRRVSPRRINAVGRLSARAIRKVMKKLAGGGWRTDRKRGEVATGRRLITKSHYVLCHIHNTIARDRRRRRLAGGPRARRLFPVTLTCHPPPPSVPPSSAGPVYLLGLTGLLLSLLL